MFPITLDTSLLPIAVIGNGEATHRRLQLFQAAGAKHLTHFKAMPEDTALAGFKVAFVADFDEATSVEIYNKLKALGLLVNIEDKRPLCDFHVPAIVRRGDLLMTVSTNAQSPRIARVLRQYLEKLFPPIWAERIAEIGAKRREWREAGLDIPALAKNTDKFLETKGWLVHLENNLPSSRGGNADVAIQPRRLLSRWIAALPMVARNDEGSVKC
jgi:precorrin-2 dehydrogenase/sirohydrochlorin ferrochelatase